MLRELLMKRITLQRFIIFLALFFVAACGKRVIDPLLVPPASHLLIKKSANPLGNIIAKDKVRPSSSSDKVDSSKEVVEDTKNVNNNVPADTTVDSVQNTKSDGKTGEDKKNEEENVQTVIIKTQPLKLTTSQETSIVNSILFD